MIKRKTNGSSCVIVKLIHKPHRKDNAFAMNTVTQTMKFRQSLLSYAEKHEVTQAAIKYNVNKVCLSAIDFLEIILQAFAQNNDLVRIFHSIFFALVNKLRTKSRLPFLALPVDAARCQVLDNFFHK